MKIDAYHFGRVEIEGQSYTSDIIVSQDKIKPSWWRREGHRLHLDDLSEVIAFKPQVLVIGTGYYGRMLVSKQTTDCLESNGIAVQFMRTAEAVEVFNKLQQECARVVAALHLTC
jgi:hypothetical protein